ncbi:hypothetical protein BASA81_000023 [Batrachochytrium salamandrivorans]|nr:hypothetical protein BASA81_000023 [Batrachochytrium salamandrivorans]
MACPSGNKFQTNSPPLLRVGENLPTFSDLELDMGDMAEFNAIFGQGFTLDDDGTSGFEDHHQHAQHQLPLHAVPPKPRMSDLARSQHFAATGSPRFQMGYSPPTSLMFPIIPTPPTTMGYIVPPYFPTSSHPSSNLSTNKVDEDGSKEDGRGEDGDDGDHSGSANDERQRRRENNKNSARNSRKKKKDYVLVLQESIQALTGEIEMLRNEVKRRQKQHQLVSQSSSSSSVPVQIKHRYVFENFVRLMVPPHMRFLLWNVHRRSVVLAPGDVVEQTAWYQTWHEVSKQTQLTGEQNERIALLFKAKKTTDHQACEERERVQFVFATISKLREQYVQLAQEFAVHRQVFHYALQQSQLQGGGNVHGALNVCTDFIVRNPAEAPAVRHLLGAPQLNPNRDVSSLHEEMKRINELLQHAT